MISDISDICQDKLLDSSKLEFINFLTAGQVAPGTGMGSGLTLFAKGISIDFPQ
jgi:hypothetical protein